MRDTILVLARDATVRAQLAQALHSAGHVAELAESPVHARSVMVGKLLSLAIVAPAALGPEGLDLIDELRATIGRVLMVGPSGHPTGGAATTVDPANPTVLLAKVAEALRPCIEPDAPAPRLRFAGHVLDPGIRDWMKANPHDSIAFETSWPLLPAFKQAYVADLRTAGLPE